MGGRATLNGEEPALRDLAAAARAGGRLDQGETIPAASGEDFSAGGSRLTSDVSLYATGGSTRALSLRSCGLASLPRSLGALAGLTHLDLTGNRLADIPIVVIFLTIGILLWVFYQSLPDPNLPKKVNEIPMPA